MNPRRNFLSCSFASFCASSRSFAADEPVALTLDPGPLPFKFVAYGDMRMTDPSNHQDSDPERRKAIIGAIAQQQPKFVLISGDLVLSGSNAVDWAEYDKEMKPILDTGATIYPALGNHDVHGDLNTALSNYFQRFSELKQSRYYSRESRQRAHRHPRQRTGRARSLRSGSGSTES